MNICPNQSQYTEKVSHKPHITKMNFDTRTVIDIITLSDELKKELQSMVDNELTFLLSTSDFTDDDFFNALHPQIKYQLKLFFKSELKSIDLPMVS